MKTTIYTALTATVIGALGAASAALGDSGLPNLPELTEASPIGRVMTFPTDKSYFWFMPAAFSSKLVCSPAGTEFKSCSLVIYNNLSTEEEAHLAEAARIRNSQLVSFTPLNQQIVQSLDETFENLPASLTGFTPIQFRTLQMMGQRPYASIAFRLKAAEADALAAQYQDTGLGAFSAKVSLLGEKTFEYLALKDGASFVTFLKRLVQTKLLPQEIKRQALEVIRSEELISKNLTPEESVILAYRFFMARFFSFDEQTGTYQVRDFDPNILSGRVVLLDTSQKSIPQECEARLILKQDAQSSVTCKGTGGVQ